jgi:predicted small lipoprotein YifL
MNWTKRKLFSLAVFTIILWITGCGVKGDPLPPEKPTELGRGRPTYKRATEGIAIEKSKAPRSKGDEEEEEEDDEGK